jgi:hypothetical protein
VTGNTIGNLPISPALVGKAGELLVAAELMRRGVEVAYPASAVGVDLLAYRFQPGNAVAGKFVPIQDASQNQLSVLQGVV